MDETCVFVSEREREKERLNSHVPLCKANLLHCQRLFEVLCIGINYFHLDIECFDLSRAKWRIMVLKY